MQHFLSRDSMNKDSKIFARSSFLVKVKMLAKIFFFKSKGFALVNWSRITGDVLYFPSYCVSGPALRELMIAHLDLQ